MTQKHPAESLETVVVDPDHVIKMMQRNWRDQDEQRSHSLRITPPFEGEQKAELHVSQRGNYYPPEMDTKPIHLGDVAFLEGRTGPPSADFPEECRHPCLAEQMGLFDQHYDTDQTTKEQWVEWWDNAMQVWEEAVRGQLVNEIRLRKRIAMGDKNQNVERVETTVDVRFE